MAITPGSPPTVSEFKAVTGRVLTVSPDGKKVIVSDTKSSPNQVFVFDTTSNTSINLPIAAATAADYSPDNLKAYILAGSTLYVYSTLEALKTIALGAPANEVSFLPEGGFAYLAGGTASSVTAWRTCTDAEETAQTVTTPSTPKFMRALSKSLTLGNVTYDESVLAVDSPGIDLFGVKITVPAPPFTTSCPLDLANSTLNITTNSSAFFNLGQGGFLPTQLIVSQDGTRAYVIASNLGSVLVFNVGNQTSSAIPLSGDAIPIQASLTADGNRLYVAAADGQVHVLDTQSGGDIQQISFPTDATTLQAGLCVGTTFTCNPDLIAVKP
jgi:DNA-binding beta-propeller fold protein YncE